MINYDYEIKTAFTLADVCGPLNKSPFYGVDVPLFVSLCDYYNINLATERNEFAGGVAFDLWRYIYIKFSDHYILQLDIDTIDDASVKAWIRLYMNVYLRTKERYNVLIENYNNQKIHLMDALKTENENVAKFNDTPQGEGDYSNDPYTTNITKGKSTTKTDILTPIQRLREIEDNYNNLLATWADEFNGIFIEEGNL